MKRFESQHQTGRNRLYSALPNVASILALTLASGLPLTVNAATNTVTSLAGDGVGSFRQVIAGSSAGDSIVFSVTGVITLGGAELLLNRDLNINGPGASALAIDASYASSVFRVATNVTASVSGLTICNGRTSGTPGAGINNSGTLSMYGCIISNNATSPDLSGNGASGGGIYSVGTLALDNCAVIFSRTANGLNGGGTYDYGYSGTSGASGGGIWNSGNLSAKQCRISDNSTGSGGNGGSGRVAGGSGGWGGDGGGIYNLGTMTLTSCTLSNNACGSGGFGASGQASAGGPGWGGSGGGIFSAYSLLAGCTLVSNLAGSGGGGSSSLTPTGGGPGGSGGGVYGWGLLLLTNCTLVSNSSGSGGPAPMAPIWFPVSGGNGGDGGALYFSGTNFVFVACSVISNAAGLGGPALWGGSSFPGPNGRGGGVFVNEGTTGFSLNNLVALNSGLGSNVFGPFTSLGCNLVATTNGAGGFNAPGDLTGSDAAPLNPGIGLLGDYGGPTPTVALLPGSPAIDHGAALGMPAFDQRGVLRPQGLRSDIGAFEFQFTTPQITAVQWKSGIGFWLQSCGLPNQLYKLQSSADLVSWSDRVDLLSGPNGISEFTDSNVFAFRFYRVKAGSP